VEKFRYDVTIKLGWFSDVSESLFILFSMSTCQTHKNLSDFSMAVKYTHVSISVWSM